MATYDHTYKYILDARNKSLIILSIHGWHLITNIQASYITSLFTVLLKGTLHMRTETVEKRLHLTTMKSLTCTTMIWTHEFMKKWQVQFQLHLLEALVLSRIFSMSSHWHEHTHICTTVKWQDMFQHYPTTDQHLHNKNQIYQNKSWLLKQTIFLLL